MASAIEDAGFEVEVHIIRVACAGWFDSNNTAFYRKVKTKMDNETIIKLTKRVLIEDLKKPELTSKEKADLIYSYKKASNKSVEELEKEIGLSKGRISQYCNFAEAVDKNTTNSQNLNQFLKDGKFGVYEWINNGYTHLIKMKNPPPMDGKIREKCKILSAKLELWSGKRGI